MSFSQSPPEVWQWRPAADTIAAAGVVLQMPTDKVADVVEIACQSNGLVFREEGGAVGVWPWQEENPIYPTGQPAGVTKIHAGAGPLLLTEDGEIWVTGLNQDGQYGDGTITSEIDIYESWHKADGSDYTDVAGAGARVIAVKDGMLWTWGAGGSLSARGVSAPTASTPQEIVGTEETEKVYGYWSAFAAMLKKEDGCVMIWGSNAWGSLGRGYTGGEEGTPQILEFSEAYPPWPVV